VQHQCSAATGEKVASQHVLQAEQRMIKLVAGNKLFAGSCNSCGLTGFSKAMPASKQLLKFLLFGLTSMPTQ
jgi:hypothetical protein